MLDYPPQIPPPSAVGRRYRRTFARADFTFDKQRGVYVCPAGKLLTTTGSVDVDHVLRYLAPKRDCDACPLKSRCCPKTPSRKVTRDINEEARDRARALMGTPEFAKSRDERRKVEMRFAHLKTHYRFERMRLRGLSGARDEFHLAAIVQNLKTLARQVCRPPPHTAERRTRRQRRPFLRPCRRLPPCRRPEIVSARRGALSYPGRHAHSAPPSAAYEGSRRDAPFQRPDRRPSPGGGRDDRHHRRGHEPPRRGPQPAEILRTGPRRDRKVRTNLPPLCGRADTD